MKRSTKIGRLQRQLDDLLRKHRVTIEIATDIAFRVEEIDEVRERMIAFGDEWQKDDHPHARGRGLPRPGSLSLAHY